MQVSSNCSSCTYYGACEGLLKIIMKNKKNPLNFFGNLHEGFTPLVITVHLYAYSYVEVMFSEILNNLKLYRPSSLMKQLMNRIIGHNLQARDISGGKSSESLVKNKVRSAANPGIFGKKMERICFQVGFGLIILAVNILFG